MKINRREKKNRPGRGGYYADRAKKECFWSGIAEEGIGKE
jgi:hypothetical protein